MTADFQPIRLAVSHGPDLHFDGKLVGSYSTQRKDGSKTRWTELRLWETPAGNWVAEMVGCSSVEKEGQIRAAAVVGRTTPGRSPARLTANIEMGAMEVWGWSTAAKAFARELGWDVVRRVE